MNLVELSQRIRKIRLERKLTLEELAARSGHTRSWLSKVENFRITPSLPALGQITEALGITLSELFEGLDEKPSIVKVSVAERKKVERDRSASNTTSYFSLAHKRPNRSMDPFVLIVPEGVSRKEMMAHEGEEFLTVLKGKIDFEFGEETHTLAAGDSLYFDATIPHRIVNKNKKEAEVLCVFFGRN